MRADFPLFCPKSPDMVEGGSPDRSFLVLLLVFAGISLFSFFLSINDVHELVDKRLFFPLPRIYSFLLAGGADAPLFSRG